MERKNFGVAIALAVLFGPAGLIYASPVAGLILFGVGLFLVWFTMEASSVVVLWPIAIGWSIVAVTSHNKAVDKGLVVERKTKDDHWAALVKYDSDAKLAMDIVREYGVSAEHELRRAYEVLSEPAKLPAAAAQIADDFKTGKFNGRNCSKCGAAMRDKVVCAQCGTWSG